MQVPRTHATLFSEDSSYSVDFENYARLLRTYETVDSDELRDEFEGQSPAVG